MHLFPLCFCQTVLDFILSDLPTRYMRLGLEWGKRSEREKPISWLLILRFSYFSELLGAYKNFERLGEKASEVCWTWTAYLRELSPSVFEIYYGTWKFVARKQRIFLWLNCLRVHSAAICVCFDYILLHTKLELTFCEQLLCHVFSVCDHMAHTTALILGGCYLPRWGS